MTTRWFRYLPILVVLVLLMAGCAAPVAPAPAPSGAEPAAGVEEVAGSEEVSGLAEVPRDRTLIMAGLGGEHYGGFTDVELFNLLAPGTSRSGISNACTEALFYYNMIGDEFIPWMGEGFEFNEDFTEVVVKIRDGVEWSDGHPFTANDVAFTINALMEDQSLNGAGNVITVESTEVVDDLTLRINLVSPDPRFVFDQLTYHADLGMNLVPEHVFKGKDLPTFSNYDPEQGWPLCTGPWRLVGSNVEQKIWDRNDDWWAAKIGFHDLPKVERLIFLPGMNELTMAQLIISNEIDMAFSMTASNMQLVQAENPKVITHSSEPPFGFLDWWPIGLGFNTTIPPFDDPEIRWAMSYAINRDEIISFAFKGTTTAIQLPFPDYPGLRPFVDSVSDLLEEWDTTEYNPAKTEEIMTRKGYTKDDEGFWVDGDGERITFEIVTFPQHPSTTPQAPIVAEQLRRAGFNTSFLLPADFATRIQTGEAVAFLWGHGGGMREPFRTLDGLYHIRGVKPTGEAIPFTNLYRWSNQEFSAIMDQMRLLPTGDPGVMPLFRDAMEIWLPELPDIMLVETVILLPMNTTYWTNWPNPDNPYIHEGFWHHTAALLFLELEPTQ